MTENSLKRKQDKSYEICESCCHESQMRDLALLATKIKKKLTTLFFSNMTLIWIGKSHKTTQHLITQSALLPSFIQTCWEESKNKHICGD